MILNLQFWENDKKQGMELARLIADLEDGFRGEFTFLFTARFDSSWDQDTVDYVSKKFPVKTIRTSRQSTGWPDGCNQMMGESFMYCCNASRAGQIIDPHRCVLLMEPDCCPLKKGWIDDLLREFKDSRKLISGSWMEPGDANMQHVNGNMIMSFSFAQKCPMIFFPPHRGGWDVVLAQHIMPHAHPSALIWSDYRLGTEHNPWKGCEHLFGPRCYRSPLNPRHGQVLQPSFYHGCKSMDAINCVREKLLTPK